MKNSPTDQPRFVCRLVRGSVSIFGDTSTGEPRGPGASHVAACEDCQQFFGACDELAVALKRDAAREWRDAPAGLEQSILRAVNTAAREAAPKPRRSSGAWMSFAAVGACAVAVTLVYQFRSPADTDLDALATAGQIVAAVPGDLFEQIRPQAEALLQQDPLQTEVDAVVSDARKAVSFLERNFLPAPANRPASGE
jgi:hypothetical protein